MPRLTPVAADSLSRALRTRAITEAEYALERAASLFHPRTVRARFGSVSRVDPRLGTMVLRDLALRLSDLSPRNRRRAERMFARPTAGASDPLGDGWDSDDQSTYCSVHLCFHWVDDGADAPPEDDSAEELPAWVGLTATAFEQSWTEIVIDHRYRPPKSDASSLDHGPDGRLDVYLADVGKRGVYGYCYTDDPNLDQQVAYGYFDLSAYCVVDNDFSTAQFPGDPLANLQVTAQTSSFMRCSLDTTHGRTPG